MRICLFDIDGTLISSGGAGLKAMEAALREQFGLGDDDHGISTAGRTDRAIATDFFEYLKIEATDDELRRFQAAYFEHLPNHLGALEGMALPGIESTLELLAQKDDVVLGLLTGNFREGARHKLSHFDLFDWFAFGGYGDVHVDRDDVARDALAEVRRLYGDDVQPGQIRVIGDTPADIKCARAIDAVAVAVATGMYSHAELAEHEPDHLFEDFSDYFAFVEVLTQ